LIVIVGECYVGHTLASMMTFWITLGASFEPNTLSHLLLILQKWCSWLLWPKPLGASRFFLLAI